MSTATRPEPTSTKADRKASARAAQKGDTYETTEFGRRRISKVPRWLLKVGMAATITGAFVVRFFRRQRPVPAQ